MAYNNPSTGDQDVYQFSNYPPSYHYMSDGSTTGGDDTNFWPNSPTRTDSPSPNSVPNQIASTYQIFTPIGSSTPNNHYSNYRNNYIIENENQSHLVPPYVPVAKRRSTNNRKERRRTMHINNAYADLRDCIPSVPVDTKLSKIKTLRLATAYISYLMRALESDDPAGGFKAELGSISRKSNNNNNHNKNNPVQVNDCSTGQVSPKSDCSEDMGNGRKAKGRTGWPQHVWALELKQEQSL